MDDPQAGGDEIQGGATLTDLDDGSILAGGMNPPSDQYTVEFVIPKKMGFGRFGWTCSRTIRCRDMDRAAGQGGQLPEILS